MLSPETVEHNDLALHQMHAEDTAKGPLSPEDEAAYRELIDSQRADHIATHIEVKDANTGKTHIEVAHSIGDAALRNLNDTQAAMAVHSNSWHTDSK